MDQKPKIILSLGGAFNPVHIQHVNIMNIAKKCLEQKGYEVSAGYLACAPDGYVRGKLKEKAMKGKHRLEMIKLLTQNDPWIIPTEKTFSSALECMQFMTKNQPEKPIYGIVVGADRAGTKFQKPREGTITICVGRPGSTDDVVKATSNLPQNLKDSFILAEGEAEDVSSTMVRTILANYERTLEEPVLQKLVTSQYETEDIVKYLISNFSDLSLGPKEAGAPTRQKAKGQGPRVD